MEATNKNNGVEKTKTFTEGIENTQNDLNQQPQKETYFTPFEKLSK